MDLIISGIELKKVSKKNKVLIITYYWPPSGGSGVQRWVKFVKYLRNFGWEPIIYTPSNPEFPEIDKSLNNEIPPGIEVLTHPIWEPYQLYKKFVGLDESTRLKTGIVQEKSNPSLAKKLSIWIRGNFFIPDARRFWIKPSIEFLSNYLKIKSVDAIVSNGTPHSLHLIGLEINKRFNIPWLADFRDPWTNIDFFDDLKLTSWAKQKHFQLEKKVLSTANVITVTTPGTKDDFLLNYPDANIEVITNGFDEDDFKDVDAQREPKFIIAHIGVLTPSRNHPFLWDALQELVSENESFAQNFTLRFIGSVDVSILNEISRRNLNPYLEYIPQLPHSKIPESLRRSNILLLVIRKTQNQQTIIPGKVFEYLAAQRPIISVGPVGSDSDQILKETKSGKTFHSESKDDLKAEILHQFEIFKKTGVTITKNADFYKYSRMNLTKNLARILDKISTN